MTAETFNRSPITGMVPEPAELKHFIAHLGCTSMSCFAVASTTPFQSKAQLYIDVVFQLNVTRRQELQEVPANRSQTKYCRTKFCQCLKTCNGWFVRRTIIST